MLLAFAIPFQKIELSEGLGEARIIWSHPSLSDEAATVQQRQVHCLGSTCWNKTRIACCRASFCFPPLPTSALQTDEPRIFIKRRLKVSPTDLRASGGSYGPYPYGQTTHTRFAGSRFSFINMARGWRYHISIPFGPIYPQISYSQTMCSNSHSLDGQLFGVYSPSLSLTSITIS